MGNKLDILLDMIYDIFNLNLRILKKDIYFSRDGEDNIFIFIRKDSFGYLIISNYLKIFDININKENDLKIVEIHCNYEEDSVRGYAKYVVKYDNLGYLYIEFYPFKCIDLVNHSNLDKYLLWGCLCDNL